MKDHVRGAVTYVAGRLISGKRSTSIYDYSKSCHRSIGETVDSSRVNVYDYEAQCHFGGGGNGDVFNLYHYGEQGHVSLRISNLSFSGYDYGAQTLFSGNVNGSSTKAA